MTISGKKYLFGWIFGNSTLCELCEQWLTANETVRGRGVEEGRTTSITGK
jgi:hypothetical protein